MGYRELLEYSFKKQAEENITAAESRLEYLSRNVFDFTTYDGDMDVLFARKAVEVCDAITSRRTFDYIADAANYKWFLIMCNMTFFLTRIEWGTSIRGAYWSAPLNGAIVFQSCELWDGDEQLVDVMRFSVLEWESFIRAVIAFAEPEMGVMT